jgi:molybdate transport system ATP-binding protein
LQSVYDNPARPSNGVLAVISHHHDDLIISPTHACIVGQGQGDAAGTDYTLGEWSVMESEVAVFFETQQRATTAAIQPSSVPAAATPASKAPTNRARGSCADAGAGIGAVARPVVEMQGVTIQYGKRLVFDQLHWTVLEGEKWVVVGGNGSGKSTLLELVTGENMMGYQQPFRLFGKKKGSGESVWDLKQKMGVVSTEFHMNYVAALQEPSNAETNTWDVVCSGFFDSVGLYQQVSKVQEQVAREWVEKFGLTDLVSPPPVATGAGAGAVGAGAGGSSFFKKAKAARAAKAATNARKFVHLSHGQQKLVLLCRSMVKSPKLLLLDEPTHGLSGENRDRLFGMLSTLVDAPDVAVVYVTHRQEEIDMLNFDNVLRL